MKPLEKLVANTVTFSTSYKWIVLSLTVLLFAATAPGLLQLQVHNRVTDWVDPEEGDAGSFLASSARMEGFINFERVLYDYTGDDPTGLMSLASLREQEQLADAVLQAMPEVTGHFGHVRLLQLTAYELQMAAGLPAEDRLPADDTQLTFVRDLAWRQQASNLGYSLTLDNHTGFMGFTFEAEPFTLQAGVVGLEIQRVIEGLDLTELEPQHVVGLASFSQHVNQILVHDMPILLVAGIGFMGVLFWIASRRVIAVVAGLGTLLVGGVAVVGTMSWLGLPFNVLNFAVLPLIMGTGIDYAIHILAEAGEEEGFGQGLGHRLGQSLGVPVVLVTLTTCLGLGALLLSPAPYLQQMGAMSSASIFVIAILCITTLPAFLAAFPSKMAASKHAKEGIFNLVHNKLAPRRWVVMVVAAGLAGFGVWGFLTIDTQVDPMAGALADDDIVMQAQASFKDSFGTDDAWFVIMQGDVVSESAWQFQDQLKLELQERGLLAEAGGTIDLPTLARAHYANRDPLAQPLPILRGVPGLPEAAVVPDPRPQATPAEMVASMQAEAPYDALLSLLIADDLGIFYLLSPSQDGSSDATEAQRDAYRAAIAAANPGDLDVRAYSFKALSHDFMAQSESSLRTLYAVSLAITLILFYGATRSVRSTLLVAAPVVLSSLVWFGLLKIVLGTIGVYQLISLVFITSIGSDYAAYLVYRQRDSDTQTTLRVTGRAVLFSAATDFFAFLIFAQTRIKNGGDMILAAALAILAIFVATLLVVPAWLPRATE